VVALIRDWDPQSELIRSGTVRDISVVSGCLEDFSAVERSVNEHETDTVFHLGAQAIVGTALRNPLATFEANVRGTYNVLEACREHSGIVRSVVVASSDKAYGDSEVLPYTEDMPVAGSHPYDVSKSCTDLISQSYSHTYGLPVVIARCGNIYGGGDLNWSRIVPGTIRSLLAGNSPIIRSNGKYIRDYVYVQDAVDAYVALALNAGRDDVKGQAFNFGPEKPRTVLEVVNELRGIMACTDLEPMVLDEVRAEIRSQYLNSEKAARVLGWRAQYSLQEGLAETVDWYKGFLGG